METWQKGEIALLKVSLRAIEKGYIPSRPMVEGARYDLIIDGMGGGPKRIQVKYADHHQSSGTVMITLTKNNGNSKKKRKYTSKEIDYILVYIKETQKTYCLPPALFNNRTGVTLRYKPSINKQVRNCNNADDYVW